MRMHECGGMETDTTGTGIGIGHCSDEKRVKLQPPPSHFNLLTEEDRNQVVRRSVGLMSHGLTKSGVIMDLMESSEFETCDEETMQYFVKQTSQLPSVEEVAEVASSTLAYREDTVARADICPKIRRPRLRHGKGVAMKIKDQYGYEISNTTYLYAEEALYLIEIGKLQLFLNKAPVSVERARALLVHSKGQEESSSSNKVKSCSVDEYVVYKHLLKQGYRLYRRDSSIKPPLRLTNEDETDMVEEPSASSEVCAKLVTEDEDVPMDMEAMEDEPLPQPFDFVSPEPGGYPRRISVGSPTTDTLIGSPSSGGCTDFNKRGIKRKYDDFYESQTTGNSTPSSSAKDNSDDEDADVEFDCMPVSDAGMEPIPETQCYQPMQGDYTVTEADSDVEICDEGDSTRVHIEEIGYDYDGDVDEDEMSSLRHEPKPSTSKGCFPTEGLVDLAGSDSEEAEEVKLFSKVWNKFVPNATIQIGFPPETLLPKGIPFKNTIYEFDVKRLNDTHDESDLEYFVDELNLNSSPGDSDSESKSAARNSHQIRCKSWKEWKRIVVKGASDILQDSLLATANSGDANTDTPNQRLNLWKTDTCPPISRTDEKESLINLVYDLYHPTAANNLSKVRLRKEVLPSYVVTIVRHDDVFPCLTSCDSLSQSGIPILVAVVSDETDIIFMKPDRSPIPSFF